MQQTQPKGTSWQHWGVGLLPGSAHEPLQAGAASLPYPRTCLGGSVQPGSAAGRTEGCRTQHTLGAATAGFKECFPLINVQWEWRQKMRSGARGAVLCPPPPPPGTVEGQEKRSDSPIRTLTPAANPCVPPPQLQELGHGAGILGLPIREGLEVAPVLHPCTEHLGMGESHYKKTFFFFFF